MGKLSFKQESISKGGNVERYIYLVSYLKSNDPAKVSHSFLLLIYICVICLHLLERRDFLNRFFEIVPVTPPGEETAAGHNKRKEKKYSGTTYQLFFIVILVRSYAIPNVIEMFQI